MHSTNLDRVTRIGYLLVATAVVIGIVLVARLDSVWLRGSTQYSLFSLLGRLSAITGVILYSVAFVLNTRWRFTAKLFGGLNRTYIAHHRVGGLAFIFLLLHPLLLASRFVFVDNQFAISQLLPALKPYDFAFNAGIFALWLTIGLLIVTFYVKLPYHIWLWTHRVLGLSFLIAGIHVFLISSDVSRDMPTRIYILTWIAVGLIAFAYRVLFHKFLVQRRKMRVSAISQTTSGVFIITLESSDNKPFDFMSGQYIFIKFLQPGFPKEEHPFSIASKISPTKIQLGVKGLGDFTKRLSELKPGAKAQVEGAFGTFSFMRSPNKKQLWLAGGIGITPFLAMAQDLANHPEFGVAMVYSVAKRQELIGGKLTRNIQAKGNFQLFEYVNEEKEGRYLDINYVAANIPDFKEREVFICGPPPMMKSMRAQLKSHGVKNKHIHTEEFSLQ